MESGQREVTLYTPGKMYTGHMDMANDSVRTTDFFNSSNIYWKNPAERSFEDAVLLHNARVVLDGDVKLSDFNKVQVRLSEVVFFFDGLARSGDKTEQLRAATLLAKTKEETSRIHLMTRSHGSSFFYISGNFYGLFKSKTSLRFIAITEATVTHFSQLGEKWQKRPITIDHAFVGASVRHIESCTFSAKPVTRP